MKLNLSFWKKSPANNNNDNAYIEQEKEIEVKPLQDIIFSNVYGYDNLTPLLSEIVTSKSITSALLAGAPGTNKTGILLAIKEYYGNRAHMIVGNSSTKAGVYDYLFENGEEIRILLIDELDKMSKTDQSALLGVMQEGVLSETKYNKTRSVDLSLIVVATCNEIKKVIEPLRTRFEPHIFFLKPYNEKQYSYIGTRMLTQEEGLHEDVAEIICSKFWKAGEERGQQYNIRAVQKAARHVVNDITKIDGYMNTLEEYSE